MPHLTGGRSLPGFDGEGVEDLPNVDGLVPVRTLEEFRRGVTGSRRTRTTPREALQRGWGYDVFRPLQGEAVDAVLAQKDCLVVLPTGGGKSLCYQVPAACGTGLVLVVSPLIALMDDQVASAREAGLNASALHTHVGDKERRQAREQLAAGTLDLLYVSPERLVIGDLLAQSCGQLVLIAIDEAHCVSHWGHDFRPEYRQLRSVLDQVPKAARIALTATATPQVQDDICAQLGLRSPARLVGHVDRPNLIYRVLPRSDVVTQALEVVRRHPEEGGIVYAQTRKEVERLAERLAGQGVQCAAYHAGLPGPTRAKVQSDFVNERLDVVVATIAFGMGIDRSNVRYVVHANAPKSIEHYQQEAGRSGRDGLAAECVLLYSSADLVAHRRLATMDGPLPHDRAQVLDRQLREVGRFAVAPVCRHRLLTEHFGQEYPLIPAAAAPGGCGACDVCLNETRELPGPEALIIAQKIISTAWRLAGRFGTGQTVDVLLGKRTDKTERAGHQALPVFGLLATSNEVELRAWVDQLVVQGFLRLREDGLYTFLEHTDAGRLLCKGEGSVRLGNAPASAKGRKSRRPVDAAASAGSKRTSPKASTAGAGLFEQLRRLRKLIATRQHIPPYLVFNDVTLQLLAEQRPASAAAMRGVKGIGDSKLARYSKVFLAVISGATPEQAVGDEGGSDGDP